VVVPCHNEEECLNLLHDRVSRAARGTCGDDYELVLVNDGSSDRTWELMLGLAARDAHLVIVDLSRNHGHQLALTAGLSVCRGERVLVLDADLQDPPELLPDMMALMDDGYDVVYGQRRERKGETWFKRASASMFYRLLFRIAEVSIPLDAGDFRLMSRRVTDTFLQMPERARFIRGMISWIGYPQTPLPYDRHERFAGTTKYPLRKMVKFAVDAVVGFSSQPLILAVHLGIWCAVLSGVLMVYAVVGWALGAAIPGWTSLAVLILFLGGIQLVFMGFLGTYTGRIFDEVKRRPLFIINEVIRGCTETPSPVASRLRVTENDHR
jgi:dolichol-phosphate mannosyltransferase